MWRNYVICVLIGLLLVSTGGSVLLTRQMLAAQSDADRLRQRVAAAESAQASLQQQLDQLKVATPGARATPAAVAAPAPGIAIGGPDRAVLQQIEDDVSGPARTPAQEPGALAFPRPGGPAALLRGPVQPGLLTQRARIGPEAAADARSDQQERERHADPARRPSGAGHRRLQPGRQSHVSRHERQRPVWS